MAVDEDALPDLSDVYIPAQKLRDYLLSPTHAKGRHKLRIFETRFGIGANDEERCGELLIEASRGGDLVDTRDHCDCRTYSIRASIRGIDGRDHKMIIVWKVPHDGVRHSS